MNREEFVIAGKDFPRLVYRYLPGQSLKAGGEVAPFGAYVYYFSADQLDPYARPSFIIGKMVYIPHDDGRKVEEGLDWMHGYALEHAVNGFRDGKLEEVAMAMATEYCRQIGCGMPPLCNYKELAKRYVKDGAIYLFSSTSDATEFANSVGLVF